MCLVQHRDPIRERNIRKLLGRIGFRIHIDQTAAGIGGVGLQFSQNEVVLDCEHVVVGEYDFVVTDWANRIRCLYEFVGQSLLPSAFVSFRVNLKHFYRRSGIRMRNNIEDLAILVISDSQTVESGKMSWIVGPSFDW